MAALPALTRSGPPRQPRAARGWKIERLLGPSTFFGANGIRFGPDGLLYVTQAFGGQVSTLDVATGAVEHVLPSGGPILAPDDIAFRGDGTAYITDVRSATTWAWRRGAAPRPYATDQPSNNGVTVGPDDRLFIDEFRPEGRLLEGPATAGAPARVILEGLNGPNALAVGRDGRLYFPQVFAGEIWSVHPDRGESRLVAGGLGSPTAVKVDATGALVVSLSAEGRIVRVDPARGAVTHVADVPPGIDNLALHADGRIFVSQYVDGSVREVAQDGSDAHRLVTPAGLCGPYGLAVRPGGEIALADGLSLAFLAGGTVRRRARLLTADTVGLVAAVCYAPEGRLYCGGGTNVYLYNTAGVRLIRGDLQGVSGLTLGPDGWLWVAQASAGVVTRVDPTSGRKFEVHTGLERPSQIATGEDGTVYVSEEARGRVLVSNGSALAVLTEGLARPQGLAVRGQRLYVLDAGRREVLSVALPSGSAQVIASDLPVGGPASRLLAMAALAVADDGAILIGGDEDGSLLRCSPA